MRRTALLLVAFLSVIAYGQSYERITDQVYLHEGGAAFTCDVFKAKKPNGAAVIFLVSGGWVSDHRGIDLNAAEMLTRRGYTCIEVVHGSQPRYKLPDITKQITRAVRYIRSQAKTYGYDPEKIGITGGSAGGHLSLLTAAKGDKGNKDAKDPIDRIPATIQATAVFFPPCDMEHWSSDGQPAFANPMLMAIYGKAFVEDPKKTTPEEFAALAKQLSPANFVTAAMPPTMIVHGDADVVVPVTQSINFKKQLDALNVPNELIIEPGKGHGFPGMDVDFLKMINWFDKYLLKAPPQN